MPNLAYQAERFGLIFVWLAVIALFGALRHLDTEGQRMGLRGIAVMPIPGEGLAPAIRDRLARAAAPRS
jgi:L-threonylcarbamoyladenylate synthase